MALQFAFKSLLSWQEWLIFIAGIVYVAVLKKNAVWAILMTIAFSLLFIH